jgi:murein DD-endopeptidase MepM/ murein hydrolase activator NlpD
MEKLKKFMKKHGFYVALGLSVTLIGVASYFTYVQTSSRIGGELDGLLENPSITLPEQNVNKPQDNVPKATEKQTPAPTTPRETATEAQTESITETPTQPAPENKPKKKAENGFEAPVVMPVTGEALNPFSEGELVKSVTTGAWQTHNGVDIKASPGDAVVAMAGGTVVEVKDDPLWGVTVTIDHGSGIMSKYCALNTGVMVSAGSEIACGDIIGAVGECDFESRLDPHLHFEVLKNGKYIDPITFIKTGLQ